MFQAEWVRQPWKGSKMCVRVCAYSEATCRLTVAHAMIKDTHTCTHKHRYVYAHSWPLVRVAMWKSFQVSNFKSTETHTHTFFLLSSFHLFLPSISFSFFRHHQLLSPAFLPALCKLEALTWYKVKLKQMIIQKFRNLPFVWSRFLFLVMGI